MGVQAGCNGDGRALLRRHGSAGGAGERVEDMGQLARLQPRHKPNFCLLPVHLPKTLQVIS